MQRGYYHGSRRHSALAIISVLLLLVLAYLCVSTNIISTRSTNDSVSHINASLNDIVTLASDTLSYPMDVMANRVRQRRQLQTLPPPTVQVKGELRKWHKVTLAVQGPMTSENDLNDNPFTNYRLDVTFFHPATSKLYKVPGYYATDGDSANTGEKDGNIWHVHFAPDQTGEWVYTIEFVKGLFVAIQPNQVGAPVFPAHLTTGTINILPTDKTGRDHRGKGRLSYVGRHHFRFQETLEYFLKAGSDR